MFKPISFLDMQRFEDRPHFVSIYKGEPSSKLNINGAEYVDDSFMLNYGNAENWPEAISNKNTDVDGYPIPAFGVTYGSQYQSYFTNIDVGMDSSMVTEQALQAQFMIGSMNSKTGGETSNDREGAINAFALGQDLFTVYSNNSYTCTVTMMGCAWVQPLMYFVLLNVPLFRGSYLIEKVKHHIAPGQMTTTFVGVRMANTLTPFVKSPFYKKNDKLNGSINAKFPNAKFASVENDCEYATFPVLTLNYDGGFTEDILNEVGGYKKYGFVPTEDDTDENRYSTLIEALTCTVIQECGSSNQLAAELVATVLFNRVKKRGDFFIFKHGQIAYDTYSSSSHPDGYDKVLEWVKNVFVNTPMVLVGKTTNVVNPVTIYDNDLLTGEYTQPLVITEDMVQRMLMYCSRQGYDASNENIGKDFHPNQGLEWTPSNWRKQTYLCHHDHTNIYGHVFTSGDGNKKYWTATPKSASYDNGVDRNGLSKFANSFIDAVQKTIDATNKINCTIYGTSGDSTNPDYFYITSSNNTQMATVFDIILNGYSRYAYRIGRQRLCGETHFTAGTRSACVFGKSFINVCGIGLKVVQFSRINTNTASTEDGVKASAREAVNETSRLYLCATLVCHLGGDTSAGVVERDGSFKDLNRGRCNGFFLAGGQTKNYNSQNYYGSNSFIMSTHITPCLVGFQNIHKILCGVLQLSKGLFA